MTADDALLRPEPLPVEHLLFDGPLARVGAFRCPAAHPLFADSGPIVNPIFVFPRTAVWIQHDGHAPFVADPTVATLYNRGQTYRRTVIAGGGDQCEWFALEPAVLAEIAAAWDPRAMDRPGQPFTRGQTTIDSRTYVSQRRLVEALAAGRSDALFVEEQVVWLARQILETAADRTGQPPVRARVSTRATHQHREHVAHARQILSLQPDGTACSLTEVARRVGVSVFHLCRVFRRHTGMTLHAYRTELRLRHALERLLEGRTPITQIALDLGFSSHSHFTAAFRRAFGLTPSAFVRQARTGSTEAVF